MQLSLELRKNLGWLAENWERKQLARLSPYNTAFYSALRNILTDCGSQRDVALVIEGTLGKVADGYAHMLDVNSEELANDPWAALRRLGEISEDLRKAGSK
ncbi:hypothetical protein H3V53_02325 [Paraburkholderia bengalensis]|uniref:Uncharacterized protein n=1 Tax=Paraburkholderia bengalensis TaxID=2747562 RepID=A0ABU8IKF7_9BURK